LGLAITSRKSIDLHIEDTLRESEVKLQLSSKPLWTYKYNTLIHTYRQTEENINHFHCGDTETRVCMHYAITYRLNKEFKVHSTEQWRSLRHSLAGTWHRLWRLWSRCGSLLTCHLHIHN